MVVSDQAGSTHEAARPHDAAQYQRSRDRTSNRAVRIDRRKTFASEAASESIAKPPRDTVHRCQHHRVRAEQRRYLRSNRRHRRPFDRDHNQILLPKIHRPLAGPYLHCMRAAAFDKSQTVLLN